MTDTRDIPVLSARAPDCPPADIEKAVAAALERLGRVRSLTVAVNDPQRHTSTRPVLEALCRHVDPATLRVLVAAGSHKASVEKQRALRRQLTEGLFISGFGWHDCRSTDLAEIGPSPTADPRERDRHGQADRVRRGQDALATQGRDVLATSEAAEWKGHPWLLNVDAVLAVGSVEPHYFAGFTGAHKTATIGLAAFADIELNHSNAMHASCRPCRLEGNPVYAGVRQMLATLESLRPVSAVNLVQAGARVLFAEGGEAMDTLQSAIPLVTRTFCRTIPRPADAIIAEVGGPLGVSFYQADKGIKNSEWAVKDGGCFILHAPCPEGIGQDHFMSLLREAATHEQAAALVARRGYRLGDHKAVRLRYLTDPRCRGVKLCLVSDGISVEAAAQLGAAGAATVEDALSQAGVRPSHDAVYRVQDAGNVCVLTED